MDQIESDDELNDFVLSQGGGDDCTEGFEDDFVENEVSNGVLGGDRVAVCPILQTGSFLSRDGL